MAPRRSLSFVLCALVSAALACGGGTPGPDDAASIRATGLAQTAAVLLTSTAAARITPATVAPAATNTAEIPPTATATVTQPPPPPAATTAPAPLATPCPNNDSEFVTDVNVPDGTHFAGGTTFNKTWRLRNDGECTWTTAYQLRYVEGAAMGGATVNLTAPVPPGATTDITVVFTAPTTNGSYTSRWQLFSDTGVAFGTKPYVQISVP